MPLPENKKYTLTSDERRKAKAAVGKWLEYFENKKAGSSIISDENRLLTRRRNLAAHLGVDESVSKKDLQLINVYSLPLPPSSSVISTSTLRPRSPPK